MRADSFHSRGFVRVGQQNHVAALAALAISADSQNLGKNQRAGGFIPPVFQKVSQSPPN
jgi:hypothetical protein